MFHYALMLIISDFHYFMTDTDHFLISDFSISSFLISYFSFPRSWFYHYPRKVPDPLSMKAGSGIRERD